MTVSKQHAKKEAARLISACPILSPRDPEAATQQAREIIEALRRNCQTDEHVTETVTRFLEQAHDWHNPIAELVSLAKQCEKHDRAPDGCERCSDGIDPFTGKETWADYIQYDGPDGNGYVRRCTCERGKWFRARDKERCETKPRATRLEPIGHSIPDAMKRAAGDES